MISGLLNIKALVSDSNGAFMERKILVEKCLNFQRNFSLEIEN